MAHLSNRYDNEFRSVSQREHGQSTKYVADEEPSHIVVGGTTATHDRKSNLAARLDDKMYTHIGTSLQGHLTVARGFTFFVSLAASLSSACLAQKKRPRTRES